MDNEGSPVTGESFYVRLDGLGDYKDLDQDGIIYIGDLDSGDYYIELLPLRDIRFRSVRQEFTSRIKWSIWP